MEAPLLLMAGPLVLALILFLLRRWPKAASVVGALAVWLMAFYLAGLDPSAAPGSPDRSFAGQSWILYGRSFTLNEQVQFLLIAVYVLLGLTFILSALYPQNIIFMPASLAIMTPLSGALMVSPFVIGAVLLLIAAGALAILIQGSRPGSTLAALRYLALSALAMPLLVSAGWMLESDQFQFLDNITLLILVAVLLLTTSFPFQIWVAPIVGESSSLVPALVFGIGHFLVVAFCLDILIAQPFVLGSAQFKDLVSGSAAATLILAGLLAVTARSFGHLLGYLLLISIGAVGAVLGTGGGSVVSVAMTMLILRTVSLIIAGAGLAMIRARAHTVAGGANQFAANPGLAWRTPLGLSLFVFGGLSLAGLPLTPGFAGTWPAVLQIGERTPWLAAILILAIAAGAFGVMRRLIPLFSRSAQDVNATDVIAEGKVERATAFIVLLLGGILALFPQLIATFGETLADLF